MLSTKSGMLLPNVAMMALSARSRVSAKLRMLAKVAQDSTDTSWSVDYDIVCIN